jgi:hypothetical protein
VLREAKTREGAAGRRGLDVEKERGDPVGGALGSAHRAFPGAWKLVHGDQRDVVDIGESGNENGESAHLSPQTK